MMGKRSLYFVPQRRTRLRIGQHAPEILLRGARLRALSEGLRHHPFILAFAGELQLSGCEAEIRAIRAELRGLGAELVVMTPTQIARFRPDDKVELFEEGNEVIESQVALVAEAFGVLDPAGQPIHSLFIVDETGLLRFCRTDLADLAPGSGDGGVLQSLMVGLSAAGRLILSSPDGQDAEHRDPSLFGRREWLVTSLIAGFALTFVDGCRTPEKKPLVQATNPAVAQGDLEIALDVNGITYTLQVEPRVTLLDALRERIGLTGTKKGCDRGQCGACTVLVEGRPVNSCLTLAITTEGQKITTVEGLANGDDLHPVQRAFLGEDAFQCGFCTPGQLMSAVGLITEGRARTDDEIREQMSGNLCRCGAYTNILAAVKRAQKEA